MGKAIKYMHTMMEYIVVFDADFMPPTNIIRQFISQWALYADDVKPVADLLSGWQRSAPTL